MNKHQLKVFCLPSGSARRVPSGTIHIFLFLVLCARSAPTPTSLAEGVLEDHLNHFSAFVFTHDPMLDVALEIVKAA